MAEMKTKETRTANEDGLVEVFVERGSNANDDPNLFVSINGVNYLLPRGETSRVPPHVAEEIARSKRAERRQDINRDKLREASKQ